MGTSKAPRFVRVGERYYAEAGLDNAVADALIEAVDTALSNSGTQRQAMRSIRSLKNGRNIAPLLAAGLKKLKAASQGVTEDEFNKCGGVLAATFPDPT